MRECVARDPCFSSPFLDRARDVAGDEFEYLLERELAARGITFQSEHQLEGLRRALEPRGQRRQPGDARGSRSSH